MKRYTIFAPKVHGVEAFNMTFALFNNFMVERAFGLVSGDVKKMAHVTIFSNAAAQADVIKLRDKFTAMTGETATATVEDISVLP